MASYFGLKWVSVLFLWTSNLSPANSQACTTGYVGPDAKGALPSYNTSSTSDVQFLFSNDHSIACYGEIQTWRFMTAANLDGPCYSSNVQIWRAAPSGSGDYVLIGENTLFDTTYCNSYLLSGGNASLEINIPSTQRIPVEPGDVIAWRDLGIDNVMRKVGYEPGNPGSSYMATVTVLQTADACSPGVGNSCYWQSTNIVGRNYGLQAQVSVPVNPPVFVNLPRTISISELLPVGTFVYQVVVNNSYTWNPTVSPKLSYSISQVSTTCDVSWFTIDQDKGNISVANVFSLTSVAANPVYLCDLNVTVSQQNGLLSSASILTVNVTNVNEPPKITNLPTTVHYSVMSQSPEVYKVNASDPDVPIHQSSLTYAIVSVEPLVSSFIDINSSTGLVSLTNPALDGWTGPAQFEVNVTVTDGAYIDGPKTLTLILENLISSPVIRNLNASVLLPEDHLTETVFYTVVSVEDPIRSSFPGYVINYTITSQTAEVGIPVLTYAIYNYPGSSATVKHQGDVYLSKALDYSVFQNYTIDVQATQYYGPSILHSDPRTLTVHVTWVNQPPSLSITPTTAVLPEDTPIGSTVPVTITASDRDVQANLMGDYLEYFVGDSHFVVDNETQTMLTVASLVIAAADDSRCSEDHLFVVFVRDAFGRTAQTTVNVTVTRNNRQSPTFNQTQYNGTVSESGSGGSFTVVQVFAVDPDCGPNGTVTYSILEDFANEYFQIDPVSGCITTKQPIDQSAYPNVTFTVTAADGGLPSLSSTATVFVTVEAVNLNAPRFVEAYDEIETRSDAIVGSTIYTFTVTDPDSDSVNDISYQSVVLQDDFDVKSDGAVVPKRNLGSFRRYTLYVVATDTGQGQDFFTDPAILVVDTYDPTRQLIDIRMLLPLSEMDPKAEEFMAKINNFLRPWVVKMEDLKYDGDDTVVTIYAYEEATSTFSTQSTKKSFVDRDALLDKLRTDIYGTPVDALRGPEFEDYEIVSVHPSYPVWVLDTPEGIATLTIVCCVALALIIVVIVALLKVFNLCCFKKTKVEPEPQPNIIEPVKSSGEEFQLSYNTGEPYVLKPEKTATTDVGPYNGDAEFRAKSPPIRPDAEFQL